MYHGGTFDKSVDVIVLGFGAAGAVTAMTAHDEGADVLIIEKQTADKRRPNTRFSAGLFLVPKDRDMAVRYMTQLYEWANELHETDPAIIRVWAEETARNGDWMEANGGEFIKVLDFAEHLVVDGCRSIDVYLPTMHEHPTNTGNRGWGWGLFQFLSQLVSDRHIEVMYGARAQWLLTNSRGDVIGVRVWTPDRILNIRAGRGVVMACGGFEFNERLKSNYLRVNPTHFYGNPENTGDGIPMAVEVGADLWHMNATSGQLAARFPSMSYPGSVPIDIWGSISSESDVRILQGAMENPPTDASAVDELQPTLRLGPFAGSIFTDRFGRRFTNELYRVHTLYYELTQFNSHRLVNPNAPSWWIFDERRRKLGAIAPNYAGPAGPLQEVKWSEDNVEEIDRGWIAAADTVGDLAAKCDLEPSVLSNTVERYNALCSNGEDVDYGRPSATLTALDSPPFYAVRLWPGGANTQGGARRDADARVIHVNGEPIPHLFSAGEFGSIYGMLYPAGGGNISECFAFGRIAGRGAAQEGSH